MVQLSKSNVLKGKVRWLVVWRDERRTGNTANPASDGPVVHMLDSRLETVRHLKTSKLRYRKRI